MMTNLYKKIDNRASVSRNLGIILGFKPKILIKNPNVSTVDSEMFVRTSRFC